MYVEEWLGKDNQLGIDIWNRKYRNGEETFDEWLDRVSAGDEQVKELIRTKKFLFGGRILANRGLAKEGRKISYSNCYVVSKPKDDLESIFDTATKLARTYSYGGGCGVDISNLSPKGARIHNAAKETSGAVSFMDLYSLVTELIGQNGRRGALMISIDCKHPDVLDFIKIKTDLNKVTKANISVRISKEFMEAVKAGTEFALEFTREATGEKITRIVDAKEMFRLIAKTNWDYAEPGALFWDRIESWNLLANTKEFEFAGTNPCAEEPLPAGGACLLCSINLSEFVKDPFTAKPVFDMDAFKSTVKISTRALNDVLDEGLPLHPLQEQRDSVANWRQAGVGIMGLADCLIKMGIRYGSKQALNFCHMVGDAMINSAIQESARLAKEYGSYPKFSFEEVTTTPFFVANCSDDTLRMVKKYGLRNSQLLTIAPTGTLSTMLGISGGIEPIYANYYTRKTESLYGEDKYYKVYTPIVKQYMEARKIKDDEDLPKYFVTAMTLNYKERIDMQAAWQKHIDASISSTVNVPHEFTVEDTEQLYMYAYDQGLKGITIFRDGCARLGILSTSEPVDNTLKRGDIIKTSDNLIGKKRKLHTGCGSLHVVALFDRETGELRETYLSKGSEGGCNNYMIGLSRMISIAARGGISLKDIVDQLNSTGSCPSYAVRRAVHKDTSKGSCCPMAVGNALMDMYKEMQAELKSGSISEEMSVEDEEPIHNNLCPECGEKLVFEEGCNICKNCGWSKCS